MKETKRKTNQNARSQKIWRSSEIKFSRSRCLQPSRLFAPRCSLDWRHGVGPSFASISWHLIYDIYTWYNRDISSVYWKILVENSQNGPLDVTLVLHFSTYCATRIYLRLNQGPNLNMAVPGVPATPLARILRLEIRQLNAPEEVSLTAQKAHSIAMLLNHQNSRHLPSFVAAILGEVVHCPLFHRGRWWHFRTLYMYKIYFGISLKKSTTPSDSYVYFNRTPPLN